MSNRETGATNGASAAEIKTDENGKVVFGKIISRNGEREPIIPVYDDPKAHKEELLGENPAIIRIEDERERETE